MLLKNLPPLSRRDFLKSTSLAGLAATTPSWLTGCGGNDDNNNDDVPTLPSAGRELRDLHFDFSSADTEITNIRLMAPLSRSHKQLLRPHDQQSRERFRQATPLLASIADNNLTHYLEAADLPADSLQTVMVFGTDGASGEPVLLSAHIHIPERNLENFAHRVLASGAQIADPGLFASYQARLSAVADPALALSKALADSNNFTNAEDIAAWLVFHHPEIMNLNADLGCEIIHRILSLPCSEDDAECFPYLTALIDDIEDAGIPATTRGGWATLVPETELVFDADGNLVPDGNGGYQEQPLLDEDGQQVYGYEIDDDIKDSLNDAMGRVLQTLFDDDDLEGQNWHLLNGISTVLEPPGTGNLGSSGFDVSASHGVHQVLHGVEITGLSVSDPEQREVEVTLRNWFLRYVNVYVGFFEASPGQQHNLPFKRKPLVDQTRAYLRQDTERSQFLHTLPTNSLAGVVLQPDNIPVKFTMPPSATSARLYFGSIGTGGELFCPEAVGATILTAIFNLALPAFFLALGIANDVGEIVGIFKEIGAEALQKFTVFAIGLMFSEGVADIVNSVFVGTFSNNIVPMITALGKLMVKFMATLFGDAIKKIIGNAIAPLIEWITTKLAISAASSSFPIAKLVLLILTAGYGIAQLATSITEIVASPALFHNDLTLNFDTSITLKPQDASFATSATRYSVSAKYSHGTPRLAEGFVPGGSATPVQLGFAKVPSGGTVSFDVCVFSADGCIVGTGSLGPVPNVPGTAGDVTIEIEQQALPLTANTQYQHTYKLAMRSGARVWVNDAAPSTTQASLSASGLSALSNISVQTRSANIGYSFQAAGQGISPCDGGAGGLLYSVQNMSLATDGEGDKGLQFTGCGWREPTAVIYDLQGTASNPGRNFFIRPVDGHFHVLSVVPGQGSMNPAQTVSWGRFNLAPTSLALHPQGYLVGVSRELHKMEILQLSEQAVSLADAPDAVPFAVMKAGLGGRPGLLDTPIAVTVYQGTILVLERGSQLKGFRRIQAFDVSANPVMQFMNKNTGEKSNILTLPEDGSEYLDLGVDGLGYIFLLNALNGGRDPSDYRLDVYDPEGTFVTRTIGVAAGRLAVGLFRTVHTLNFETLTGSTRTEPTVSQWIPVTPGGCG